MTHNYIRPAVLSEIDELNQLIKIASKPLSDKYYSSAEIDGLNQYVFGVDSELIEDKTYFVIERSGLIIACGGWSKRATLFGGDQCSDRGHGYLDPSKDAAKIRAFFIHADYARQGLGGMLMTQCENEARKNGFSAMELMSTLPGIPFYEKFGFVGTSLIDYPLPNGVIIKLKPMSKAI